MLLPQLEHAGGAATLPVTLWHKLPRDEAHEERYCRKGAKVQAHGVSEGVSSPNVGRPGPGPPQMWRQSDQLEKPPERCHKDLETLGAHPLGYSGSPARLDGMGNEPRGHQYHSH